MLTNVSEQQDFDAKDQESVPISLDIHDNYFPESNNLFSESQEGNTMTNNNNANVRQRRAQTANSKNNNYINNNKSTTTDEDDNDSDSNMDGILHSSEKPLLNKKSNKNNNKNNKNNKNKNKNNKNNNNNNNNSSNDSSNSNDKPNTSNNNSNNGNNGNNVEISGKKESKIKKFCTRFLTTWSMIALFGFLLYLGHFFVAALLVALQAQAFREISDLGAIERIQLQLSGYKLLHWHLFLTSLFFLYGQTLLEMSIMTKQAYFVHASRFLLRHHGLITFSMVCLGLISFVLSLKKGFYKYQFKQLAWCLVIIIVVVGQSAFAIRNLFEGMIWLVIPALCIITNDIMAYMCGMSFGRTPLIKLSPNKTWEGAIGGGFFTIIIAFIFSPLAINYQMMICPKRDWTFDWPQCDKDYTFLQQPYSFPENVQNIGETIGISSYWMNDWMVAPFQFHALMFAAFASIVGPFGGFFASGFKRAFGIKDFANIIPGHGGITDRMDCQILMCAFVYVYRKSFVQTLSMTVTQLLAIILQMSNEDQRALLQGIQAAVDDNDANNMS